MEPGRLSLGCQHGGVLVKVFWGADCCSHCVSHDREQREGTSSVTALLRLLIPFMASSNLTSLPKAPPPDAIGLVVGFQHMNEGH